MSGQSGTFDQWGDAVGTVMQPGESLVRLNSAVIKFQYNDSKENLENVARCLEHWRLYGTEKTRILLTAALQLQSYIENYKSRNTTTNIVINRMAGNVGQSRLYELSDVTELARDGGRRWLGLPVGPGDRLPPFTLTEIGKMNEAFARSYRAAELARDEMIKIAAKRALSPRSNVADAAYRDYFGAFDPARAKQVLANFKDIVDGFDQKVKVYDVRNYSYGVANYAACIKAKVTRGYGDFVTSRVQMLMCRYFFLDAIPRTPGSGVSGDEFADDPYTSVGDQTTRATVQTIVHEMAHGCFAAIDAPRVKSNGDWELRPKTDADEWGASPDNAKSSSNRKLVKRLALKDPAIALVNADCYGQFAVDCLDLSSRQ